MHPHNDAVTIAALSNACHWLACCTGGKIILDKLFYFQHSPAQVRSPALAQRETARVYVHLGDADESQWSREAEARGHWALAQQVGQLVPLLETKRGIVEHPAMQVARLLNLQLVDVVPKPHELPRQLLVLQPHVCLQKNNTKMSGSKCDIRLFSFIQLLLCI